MACSVCLTAKNCIRSSHLIFKQGPVPPSPLKIVDNNSTDHLKGVRFSSQNICDKNMKGRKIQLHHKMSNGFYGGLVTEQCYM